MYQVNNDADISGTSFIRTFSATYQELVKALGEPIHYDGDFEGDGKVSTEWVIEGRNGPWTIYDWKETSLWDGEYDSPTAFRARSTPYDWHIGGPFVSKEDLQSFMDWLLKKTEGDGQ